MALMIMSICSTICVLTLHHSQYPVPSWIKTLAFGFLAKMLCVSARANSSSTVRPTLPSIDQNVQQSTITSRDQGKQHKPPLTGLDKVETLGGWSDKHLEKMVWYKDKQAEEEAQHAEWMRVAAIMDRLFLFLFTVATIIISVVLLGIYPLTSPSNMLPRNIS